MMNKKIKKMLAALLVAVTAVSFAGCSNVQNNSEQVDNNEQQVLTSLDKIKQAGKIVLGTSADYPPYEFHVEIDKKDTIVGFDIEIAKEIAKDLGVELVIVDMKFDGLLAALNTGNVDFVIAGMSPTAERAESVDFSQIYYKSVQSVVVRAQDAASIKSVEDLKGLRVAAQKGSIQEDLAKNQIPEAKVQSLGKISDLVLELKNNKVNAAIIEYPVASAYVSKNSDLAIADISLADEDKGSAVAIKKGNEELLEQINSTLQRLIDNNLIDQFVEEATELADTL